MDVTDSSQGSSKDDKEGEVSSTCNDSRNNEEQTRDIDVASNTNNPNTPESSEPTSVQDGSSAKRSLSPDTSNSLNTLAEESESYRSENTVEVERSIERNSEHRGRMASGGSDSVPSVSSEMVTPESNQPSGRGNSEEILTSTTEDSVIVTRDGEEGSVAISESVEELENRPSSGGQNNPLEDLISVSSATNAQNPDGAGNSNISGLIDAQEEVDTAVDSNVPSLPGAADSTTIELLELSDDSASSAGENFGVSTTAREMWQVSTTQSFLSNSETPNSECVPSVYGVAASASTSRGLGAAQSMQRECQQSDTVSATENSEGANVSTTIREVSRSSMILERLGNPSNRESGGHYADRMSSERGVTASPSVSFPGGDFSPAVSTESSSVGGQSLLNSNLLASASKRKNADSVSSSKDCFSKPEEPSESHSNVSTNQESSIDTTTGVIVKSSPGSSGQRSSVSQGQSSDLSSFSITTSNSDGNASSASKHHSREVEDPAMSSAASEDPCNTRSQTDSRVSTSGQRPAKGGATSTTVAKSEERKGYFGGSSTSGSSSTAHAMSIPLKENRNESSSQSNVKRGDCRDNQAVESYPSECDVKTTVSEGVKKPPNLSLSVSSEVATVVSIKESFGSDSTSPPKMPPLTSGNQSENEPASDTSGQPDVTESADDDGKSSSTTNFSAASSKDTLQSTSSTAASNTLPPSISSTDISKEDDPMESSSPAIMKIENVISLSENSNEKEALLSTTQSHEIEVEEISCEVMEEAFVRDGSDWSDGGVLIGEEVSMSAVEEALFSDKSELDQYSSRISMENTETAVQIKSEPGLLKRFGSSHKEDSSKKMKTENNDGLQACELSNKSGIQKTDVASCSKNESSPPKDNLEVILSAMEGSSIDTSSASCTPPLADPLHSNENSRGGNDMESIMADLLKSKMETADADSGSDEVQIIEVIEHPRKEPPAEPMDSQGVSMGERILVEIGEGGGIRVGPMQPSRGSIRTTRGLPGITVVRGAVRGRGRGSRGQIVGTRGNQVAMRRIGRGTRGASATRGRGGADPAVPTAFSGLPSIGGTASPSAAMAMSSPRGLSLGRGLSITRAGVSPKPSERGSGRGLPLGRPPGRGLSRGTRGMELGRAALMQRGRGTSRGIGLGGGRGSATLGRGIPASVGRGISITPVGRGMVLERLSPPSGRGLGRGVEGEGSGVVISPTRGFAGGRLISRGADLGGLTMMRGMSPGRGPSLVRSGVRGSRGMGRGVGRPSTRGRVRGSGGRGSAMSGISLGSEITLLPQEMKMPVVQLDMSVGSDAGSMVDISGVKREGLTIIPRGPMPSMIKEEEDDSSSHDVIVVAEVGGDGTVKLEKIPKQEVLDADDKLTSQVSMELSMEDFAEGGDGASNKRKRKPRKPLELSPEAPRPKRPRKAKTKPDGEPKSKKGKKAAKKGGNKKGAGNAAGDQLRNGGFTGKLPIPIDSHSKPTIQIFEEETRMSADSNSRSQTPARTITTVGINPEEEASQGSLLSNGTTESAKKKVRLEVYDPDSNVEFTAENLAEYQWPLNDKTAEHYMIQEQVSEYLGVKSFKRKYPDLKRRVVEAEEKAFLRERGMVSESLCDMGLTALNSSEVLDVMFADFQDKYEEYRRVTRDRQAKEISNRQKAVSVERNKQSDYKRRAMKSAASWNSSFNKERKEERRCCFDMQTFTIHYPKSKTQLMTRDRNKIGNYPIALIPGQYTDYYKRYTPTELRYYPLNTVLYGPMRPNEMEEHVSDGSQSESEDSSSSDDSSSSCSEGTQDTEETCSTADLEGDGAGQTGAGEGKTASSGPVCKVCNGDQGHNKLGRSEPLIQCAQCESSGHPSCLDLTLDMVPHIKSYDWQCTDCKTCIECKDPADEDKMLFCDMCDRGYHIYCVGLRKVPSGSWHCQVCSGGSNESSKDPMPDGGVAASPQWPQETKKNERPQIPQIISTPYPKGKEASNIMPISQNKQFWCRRSE